MSTTNDKLLTIVTRGGAYMYVPIKASQAQERENALMKDLASCETLPRHRSLFIHIRDTDSDMPLLTVNGADIAGWFWQELKPSPSQVAADATTKIADAIVKQSNEGEEWRDQS